MGRVFIATIIGAVLLFAWGMISWMMLPWHNETLHELKNESEVMALLATQAPDPGMYVFPSPPEDWTDAEFNERHEKGPVGILNINAGGPVMPPTMWVGGWAINLLVALVASWLLYLACPSLPHYFQRVAFVTILGIFVAIQADANLWNWMHYPTDYSVVMAADRIVGMFLVGIFAAAIVRRRKPVEEG